MPANRIQHHIKIIIHQVAFLLEMQVWFNIRKPIIITHHINRCGEKNHMYDCLYRCYKKIRYKCTITSWLKTLPRIGIDGCFLSVTKTIFLSVSELEPRTVEHAGLGTHSGLPTGCVLLKYCAPRPPQGWFLLHVCVSVQMVPPLKAFHENSVEAFHSPKISIDLFIHCLASLD